MGERSEISKEDIIKIVDRMYRKIEDNRDYLSRLDTEIGDGDHGFSMASGFKNFHLKLDEFAKLNIGQLMKKGGFELIKTIGGASGAVFGTFFTGQASYYEKNLEGKERLTLQDFTDMLEEALKQIKQRGNAQVGDKTMIDAMEPAVDALKKAVAEGSSFADAFKKASKKAKEGAESTKDLPGKRGRSKNLAERARGFIDPGAVSTALLFDTFSEYFSQ
jgi:dihydroxyacetone kinase-like protein